MLERQINHDAISEFMEMTLELPITQTQTQCTYSNLIRGFFWEGGYFFPYFFGTNKVDFSDLKRVSDPLLKATL